MKKCPECNNLVEDNLKECSKCGFPFDGVEKNIEESNNVEERDMKLKTEEVVDTDSQDENNKTVEVSMDKVDGNSDEEFQTAPKIEKQSADNSGIQENDQEIREIKNCDISQVADSNKKQSKLDRRGIYKIITGVALVVSLICAFYFNGKYHEYEEKYEEANRKVKKLEIDNGELESTVTVLNSKIDELENGASSKLVEIKNAYEKSEWQKVIELASKLHEKYNGSEEDKQAQEMASQSQAKIDEANAAKAAEEARGYETGITYDQLARTPDDYNGKKVKFYGKVLQVIEGDGSVQIRLAVDDNYDTVLLGEYLSSTVSSRVLEDDYITIYGTSVGTISYKSTMGGTITIPGVYIDKIEQ